MHTILEKFEETVNAFPDQIAVEDADRHYSWKKLRDAAQRAGTVLSSIGCQRKPVVLMMEKSCEALALLYGVLYSGGFYVFVDTAQPDERIRRETGNAAKLCFAMKCNPFLMPLAVSEVDRIEVCSYGVYCICRKDGIDPGKLLISGVLKKPAELKRIVEECGSKAGYTVESMGQFAMLDDLARKRREKLRGYIRLTSGNQFGLDRESANTVLSWQE